MINTIYRNLLYLFLGLVCLLAGFIVAKQKPSLPPSLASAQLLPQGKKLSDVKLDFINTADKDENVFIGRWTIVFFGFTSCPDLCPMELQKLSSLLQKFEGNNQVQVLFVSVDPERDTTEKLASYLQFFNPQMLGARGENKEVAKLARVFGAAYDRSFIQDNKVIEIRAGMDMPTNTGDVYQVNHSLRFFLVNEQGEYVGSFAPPHDTQILVEDMQALTQ